MQKKIFLLYVRNFIFGVEDSLVSTVGMLAGVASAGVARSNILIAGIVLIFVEAFSMSVGSFLSERATEESGDGYRESRSKSLPAAIIMLVSYFFAGFIPLAPYFLGEEYPVVLFSVLLTLAALFALGLVSARILHTPLLHNGVRMLVVGGLAVAIGVVVGIVAQAIVL